MWRLKGERQWKGERQRMNEGWVSAKTVSAEQISAHVWFCNIYFCNTQIEFNPLGKWCFQKLQPLCFHWQRLFASTRSLKGIAVIAAEWLWCCAVVGIKGFLKDGIKHISEWFLVKKKKKEKRSSMLHLRAKNYIKASLGCKIIV